MARPEGEGALRSRDPGELPVPVRGETGVAPPAPVEPGSWRPPGEAARLRSSRRRFAFLVAIAADLLQVAAQPLFAAGGASPAGDVLDVAVAVIMIRVLGWHWAFLPTFIVELIPFVDLVPTWTAAVWIATRGRRG